jgi:putative acetyltransferase
MTQGKAMTDIAIRAAAPADADDLAAIYAHVDVVANTGQIPLRGRDFWRDFYRTRDPNGTELVAVVDGKAVGHLGILGNASPRRRHVASFGLCVHPDYQGRGIGSALMRAMLDLADNWLNLVRVELSVFSDNATAIALYKKHGFVIEGEAKADSFRAGRYVNTTHMARLNPRVAQGL